jgi:hypothetical protein
LFTNPTLCTATRSAVTSSVIRIICVPGSACLKVKVNAFHFMKIVLLFFYVFRVSWFVRRFSRS